MNGNNTNNLSQNNINNINDQEPTAHIQKNDFYFHLSQRNKIRPKNLNEMDIIHLVKTNNVQDLDDLIYNLSQEDFQENGYFDLSKSESRLIKCFQILLQYLIHSVNYQTKKNQILNELSVRQLSFNQSAEQLLERQRKKIKDQEEAIESLTNNCLNLEFLIKQLNLEDRVAELGLGFGKVDGLSESGFENLREKMGGDVGLDGEKKG